MVNYGRMTINRCRLPVNMMMIILTVSFAMYMNRYGINRTRRYSGELLNEFRAYLEINRKTIDANTGDTPRTCAGRTFAVNRQSTVIKYECS